MIRHTVSTVSHFSLIFQAFPFYADPTVYFYGVGLYFDLPGDTGNFYISNLQLLSNPLVDISGYTRIGFNCAEKSDLTTHINNVAVIAGSAVGGTLFVFLAGLAAYLCE